MEKPKFREGALPYRKREQFIVDCSSMTDLQLATKYKLKERTATNWRVRLVGSNKKPKGEFG